MHSKTNEPNCISPTKYVMYFLAKSTTLYNGSMDWRKDLKKNDSKVQTAFAKTRAMDYTGFAAYGLYLTPDKLKSKEPMVTSHFTIQRNNNNVTILSEISDMNIVKTCSPDEAACFQKLAVAQEKTEDFADNYSVCSRHVEVTLDKDNQWIIHTKSSCKTKISLIKLLEALNKHTNN